MSWFVKKKVIAYKQVVKQYQKEDYIYYTTYDLKISKKAIYLKQNINGYTITNEETNTKLFTQIKNIETKPYIIPNIEGLIEPIYNEYVESQRKIEEEEEYYEEMD